MNLSPLILVISLFLSPLVEGQDSAGTTPVGIPVRVLIAGPNGGLVQMRLISWGENGPQLLPLAGKSETPGGAVAWFGSFAPKSRAGGAAGIHIFPAGCLKGEVVGGDGEGEFLNLAKSCLGSVQIPVPRIRGLLVSSRTRGWRPTELLAKAGKGEEILLLPARWGFDSLAGFLFRFSPGKIHFARGDEDEAKIFPLARVAALVRGPDPGALIRHEPKLTPHRVSMCDGSNLALKVTGFRAKKLQVTLPWGGEATLAIGDLVGLHLSTPNQVFLSSLIPKGVEETSLLGKGSAVLYPWQRDQSCLGKELRCGNMIWDRGIGCHAGCRLTYALEGKWSCFQSLVGIDDSTRDLPFSGDATARVLLDGKVIWGPVRLTGGKPPVPVGPLQVAGGKELVLAVDFGEALHLGDRVNWLLPLLSR